MTDVNSLGSEAEQLIQDAMKEFGVDRDTAAALVSRTFEAMLLCKSEAAAKEVFLRSLYGAIQGKELWAVQYLKATYQKSLPVWAQVCEESAGQGQDPATALSVRCSIPMSAAKDAVKIVSRIKDGETVDAIAEETAKSSQNISFELFKSQAG
ncbi:hypothetical protein [Streptomyces cucumeris]|uniref:hypothetical protein n=1 Tax=Streptomyces cucumeris TaxID=2962890 RepID=UPI0020C8FF3A|nr:hypothetical protein [Streptomyces sp. NEAU-Y11]MCP9209690.1 hypothetical protein [Streptomyces sp. NEAU-Y11]